jgi:hypothetical protein
VRTGAMRGKADMRKARPRDVPRPLRLCGLGLRRAQPVADPFGRSPVRAGWVLACTVVKDRHIRGFHCGLVDWGRSKGGRHDDVNATALVCDDSGPHADTHQVWLTMQANTLIRLSVTPPEGSSRPPSPTPVATPTWRAGGDDGSTDESTYNPHWGDDGGSWSGPHPVRHSERI